MQRVVLVENGIRLDVYFPYNGDLVEQIKLIPGRTAKWDETQINPQTGKPKFKCWSVPLTQIEKLADLLYKFCSWCQYWVWYTGTEGAVQLQPGMKYADALTAASTKAANAKALAQSPVTAKPAAKLTPKIDFSAFEVKGNDGPSAFPEFGVPAPELPTQAQVDETWARSVFDKTPPTQAEIDGQIDREIIALLLD